VAFALRGAPTVGDDFDVPEHDELCADLLEYMRENPDAMDTVTGIAEWWLPRDVRAGIDEVARALQTLEARGLVERVGGEDRPMFRLRRPPLKFEV